jgi:hypothetical protein
MYIYTACCACQKNPCLAVRKNQPGVSVAELSSDWPPGMFNFNLNIVCCYPFLKRMAVSEAFINRDDQCTTSNWKRSLFGCFSLDAWSMYIRYVDFVAHDLYYVTQITSLDGGSPLIPIPMGPFWQRAVLLILQSCSLILWWNDSETENDSHWFFSINY